MNGRGFLIALSLAVGGCSQWGPSMKGASLVLKINPYHTHAEVPLLTTSNIHHLIIKLSTVNGAEQPVMNGETQVQRTIANASLGQPVVFSYLKVNSTYRVRAYAYATSDESLLISTEDASSYTDITVNYDDQPNIADLKVKLLNTSFNGEGTSSINVINGTYSYAEQEHLTPIYSTEAFVGSGYTGLTDGTGANADFNWPCALVSDSASNLYVVDGENHAIRKVSPAGVVTTLAGTQAFGAADGTGTDARFNQPRGIAIHPITGDLYIADRENHVVRKVTTSGVVSTLAGDGVAGATDANGTNARFNGPAAIAIDATGSIYVAEYYGNRIRRIASNGDVTTLAGSGENGSTDEQGLAATFDYPYGLTIAPDGNLYVVNHGASCIRRVTPTGTVTTIAGKAYFTGSTDGFGTNTRFNWPQGIASDPMGNLFVGDKDNYRIRLIETNGRVSTLAGDGVSETRDGLGTVARMESPRALAIGPDGTIYIADGHRIRKMH